MKKITLSLILLLVAMVTHAQQFNITGSVIDKKVQRSYYRCQYKLSKELLMEPSPM